MTCTGEAYASPLDYAQFWCLDDINEDEETTIQHYLDIAVSDIHVALASSGQCDCNLATWANVLLRKLNIVDAVLWHRCRCGNPKMTVEERRMYMEWMDEQLRMIRTGEMDLCDGATGADWPALGFAQQGVTEFARAQIIVNDILENYGSGTST